MTRRYWAQRDNHIVGPHASREEAAAAFFAAHPDEPEVMTGYGTYGGHFDIQWVKRPTDVDPDNDERDDRWID